MTATESARTQWEWTAWRLRRTTAPQNLYDACALAYEAFRRCQEDEWETEETRLREFGMCTG